MRFLVLGPVAAEADGRLVAVGRPRQQAILGFLLLNRNTLVSTDRLVTALWEDDGPSTARNQVQTDLSILRRLLRSAGAPDIIRTRPAGYSVHLADGDLDLDEFTASTREARATADPATAISILRSALALWTGTPLSGVKAPYAGAYRVAIEEQRLQAYEHLFDLKLGLGRHASMTAELLGLVEENPLRERLVCQLMMALYRDGRQAEGLSVARRLRTVLAEQHGLDPGRGIQELELAILRGDPVLDLPPGPVVAVSATPAAGLWPVPKQLPRNLYGITERPDHVTRLTEILADSARTGEFPVAVLTGMAGAGKTTLAIDFAHQIADQFPDGQLYVNLRGFDINPVILSPADALRGFLAALGDRPERLPDDPDALATLYRTRMAERRILVLLDYACDAAQVRPLLPGNPRCAVLVTSRNQMAGLVATDGAQIVTVGVLSDEQANDLMIRRLGSIRIDLEPEAAADIAARCARLPVALAIVSANAATKPALALASIAQELRDAWADLGAFRIDDEPYDIAAIFSWSYNALSADAARFFRALAAHPVPEVSLAAAASLAGLPQAQASALMAELARANLITEYTAKRYTTHDLLRAYAHEKARAADAAAETQRVAHRLFDHYLHSALRAAILFQPGRKPLAISPASDGVTIAAPASQHEALVWLQTEHRALLAVTVLASEQGFDRHAWQLAWCLSEYLNFQGHWADWLRLQKAAVQAATRLDDHKARALAHRGLGQALMHLRHFDEAEEQFRLAQPFFSQAGDRAGEALTVQMLADNFAKQGRYREALAIFGRALKMYTDIDSVFGRATALNNLGMQLVNLGRHTEALAPCTEALAVFTRRGDVHAISAVHDTLGNAHYALGDPDTALEHFRSALKLNRQLGSRYRESETLTRIGEVHLARCDRTAAVRALEQALVILRQLRHPDASGLGLRLGALTSGNLEAWDGMVSFSMKQVTPPPGR